MTLQIFFSVLVVGCPMVSMHTKTFYGHLTKPRNMLSLVIHFGKHFRDMAPIIISYRQTNLRSLLRVEE